MPTTLPRVNVAFERSTYEILEAISKVEHASKSQIVSKLVQYALDLAEDLALVHEAKKRLETFQRDDAISSDDLLKWNKSRRGKET